MTEAPSQKPTSDPEGRQMLARMTWISAALGTLGSLIFLIVKGTKWGAGFAVGAAFSMLSLEWWKAIGRGLDGSGRRPVPASAALLALRFPLIAGVLYVIVKFTGVASGAVIGGLLVSLAGIVIEVLHEAGSQKH